MQNDERMLMGFVRIICALIAGFNFLGAVAFAHWMGRWLDIVLLFLGIFLFVASFIVIGGKFNLMVGLLIPGVIFNLFGAAISLITVWAFNPFHVLGASYLMIVWVTMSFTRSSVRVPSS